MRGLLRIASARVPFQRAGLAWPTTAPVEVHITALDGERLLRLIRDPVLTIQMSDEDGKFHPLSALDKEASVADLDRIITMFASDAPPVVIPPVEIDAAELERLRQVDATWHADQRHLHDQGFQSLEALTSAWAVDRATLNQLQADGIEQGKLLADAKEMASALEKLQAEDALLLKRVAELEAELVKAKKPAAKPKAAE